MSETKIEVQYIDDYLIEHSVCPGNNNTHRTIVYNSRTEYIKNNNERKKIITKYNKIYKYDYACIFLLNDEDKYECDKIEKYYNFVSHIFIYNGLNDLERIVDYNCKKYDMYGTQAPSCLIVIDGINSHEQMKNEQISRLMACGRHYSTSVIIFMHSLTVPIKPDIRNQIDNIIICKNEEDNIVNEYIKNFLSREEDFHTLISIYDTISIDSYILVNNVNQNSNNKFYYF